MRVWWRTPIKLAILWHWYASKGSHGGEHVKRADQGIRCDACRDLAGPLSNGAGRAATCKRALSRRGRERERVTYTSSANFTMSPFPQRGCSEHNVKSVLLLLPEASE